MEELYNLLSTKNKKIVDSFIDLLNTRVNHVLDNTRYLRARVKPVGVKRIESYNLFSTTIKGQELFKQMNSEVLEYLYQSGYNLDWSRISFSDNLSEKFITEHHKHLSPTVIMRKYYDNRKISTETAKLYGPHLGVLNRVKYGFINENELIGDWNTYGPTLQSKLKRLINDDVNLLTPAMKVFLKLN